MSDTSHKSAARPGQRVILYGHAWRVVAVVETQERSGSVAEPAGPYEAAPPRLAGREDAPWCVVVGGPNGAGKTTFALEFLPRYADCREFINPDLIAAGLSPLDPPAAAFRAGRLVLERIRTLAGRRVSFGFETTFAGHGHLATLARLRMAGYRICLILVWVFDIDLCAARISSRVRTGGHSVPTADLQRRLPRISANLAKYQALADRLLVIDNTDQTAVLVYERAESGERVMNARIFETLRREVGL